MSRLVSINPQDWDLIFGPLKVDGYAEGEFVTIEQSEDTFLVVAGSNGEIARSLNGNDLSIVTFKLMQTSRSNVVLSGLHQLDKATKGRSPQALMVKDGGGTTIWVTPTAWIVKPPNLSGDKQAKPLEWQIACVGQPPTNIIGGN